MEYTCIGDTVNTAARLEQINKELNSKIIICETTYEALGMTVPAQAAGAVTIRGKSREVRPYVISHSELSPARLQELRQRVLGPSRRLGSLRPPPPDGTGVEQHGS
jgi:adenylate cyclase